MLRLHLLLSGTSLNPNQHSIGLGLNPFKEFGDRLLGPQQRASEDLGEEMKTQKKPGPAVINRKRAELQAPASPSNTWSKISSSSS